MLQDLLWLIVSAVVARAVWRVVDGVMAGLSGQQPPRPAPTGTSGGAPVRGVQMVRDPVCGTHVLPSRALVVSDGSQQVFFCSTACRDAYRAGHAARPGRQGGAEGRTA